MFYLLYLLYDCVRQKTGGEHEEEDPAVALLDLSALQQIAEREQHDSDKEPEKVLEQVRCLSVQKRRRDDAPESAGKSQIGPAIP